MSNTFSLVRQRGNHFKNFLNILLLKLFFTSSLPKIGNYSIILYVCVYDVQLCTLDFYIYVVEFMTLYQSGF